MAKAPSHLLSGDLDDEGCAWQLLVVFQEMGIAPNEPVRGISIRIALYLRGLNMEQARVAIAFAVKEGWITEGLVLALSLTPSGYEAARRGLSLQSGES